MISGLLGNFIDRLFFGEVTDFISFIFFGSPFAVFNVADICLCVGVIMAVVHYCFFDKDGYVDTDYTGISKSLFDKIYNKDMKPSKAYEVYTDGLYGDVISYEEVPKNWFHL
jgi:hypothetical protein